MKVVLLAGNSESTRFIYHGVSVAFQISTVIIEKPVSRKKLLKGRIKRIGYLKVFDQLIFQVFLVRILNLFVQTRISELKKKLNLNNDPIPEEKISRQNSVNSEETISLLKNLNPDIVLVSGTRIISRRVLSAIDGIFINSHVGITPQYRGVHGAYWALAKNDPGNCGVTVHKVDSGIDTGAIISQKKISISSKDNFCSYKYLQFAEAIELLKEALASYQKGELEFYEKNSDVSKLYYHPTFTGYMFRWIFKGVK
jgi:methionyl-tRNA formyltransferase